MTVRNIFERLTAQIGPGQLDEYTATLVEQIIEDKLERDEHGNFHYRIGGGNEGFVFAAHLDTVARKWTEPKRYIIKDAPNAYGPVMVSDGNSILGADDRAGCAILCYMIRSGVPGDYVFFTSEEEGCIGSSALAATDWPAGKKAVVSFDRRGYESIITHQTVGRTASDAFARALADELMACGVESEMRPDPTGSYTDSAKFAFFVPECTNVSVGYFGQHSKHEQQDLGFLEMIAEAARKARWDKLPIERDPESSDNYDYFGRKGKRYKGGWDYYTEYDYDDDYHHRYGKKYRDAEQSGVSLAARVEMAVANAYGSRLALLDEIISMSNEDVQRIGDAILDLMDDDLEAVITAILHTYPDSLLHAIEDMEDREGRVWAQGASRSTYPSADDRVLEDFPF